MEDRAYATSLSIILSIGRGHMPFQLVKFPELHILLHRLIKGSE